MTPSSKKSATWVMSTQPLYLFFRAVSRNLWRKSGEYCPAKAAGPSGASHCPLKATMCKEAHNPSTESMARAALQRKALSWTLLPTYLCNYLPTRGHAHTHPVHLPEKGTIQYWSRKDRLTSAEDWNGKSILEYLTVPQFPLWLPPNAEIDRFALTLAFYVPSFFLLWYSCCPSGRFKDYQELFPPFSQEVQPEVQAVRRKPSKMPTTYLQESQVSEENSEDWTLVGDKKTSA